VRGVLIADDEPGIRRLVRACIASDDCAVVEAADGDQAWDLIRARRCAVAILAVRLPGTSGLEVTRRTKADPRLAGTYVIVLSAAAGREDVAAGLAAGADLYVIKPFSPVELRGAVERALGAA
jgi:DNA-binding response OmpR family regulator